MDSKTQICLVFDDGFIKSCLRTAEIFELRGLRATFAVLIDYKDFMVKYPKGDFGLWNELRERGHIIHPHGYDHSDLSKISFEAGKEKIDACLAYFEDYLGEFNALKCIYHFTYNRSTPEIESYVLTKVRAIRTMGIEGNVGDGMNFENDLRRRIYKCSWHGPEHCDDHLMRTIRHAEIKRPQLMMYMLHGLDNEGWGPIHSNALENTLDYILSSQVLKLNNLSVQ